MPRPPQCCVVVFPSVAMGRDLEPEPRKGGKKGGRERRRELGGEGRRKPGKPEGKACRGAG